MLKVLIMGAGALGCFVGGHLAAGGQRVTLVGRPPLMQKIAREGLTLRRPGRPDQAVFPETATGVAGLAADYDFILLTVKAPATAGAIEQLATLSPQRGKTYLVSLQNGLGNEEQLAAAFGRERVVAGTVTVPIHQPAPGVVEVSKAKGGVGLAPLHPAQPVAGLAEAFNRAGLAAAVYDDYLAMKWSKLLLNIVNNASCAILNETPARIIAQPALFDLEIKALQEAVAVMKAKGINAVKLPGYPVDWLVRLVAARWLPLPLLRAILRPFMLSGRGAKMPSLYLDLAAGRPASEIGVLNGAIARAGPQAGVPTPVNQALTAILSRLVSGELNWAEYQHQPQKLLAAVAAR